jgi:pimeloyl-ACP methyl ester carboxylesterase
MSTITTEQKNKLSEFYTKKKFTNPTFYIRLIERIMGADPIPVPSMVAQTQSEQTQSEQTQSEQTQSEQTRQVVLLPGSFLSPKTMNPIAQGIHEMGQYAAVHSVDYQMSPGSQNSLSDYIVAAYLKALAGTQGRDVVKTDLIGHSLGTVIAMAVLAIAKGIEIIDPDNGENKGLIIGRIARIAGGPAVIGPKEMLQAYQANPEAMLNGLSARTFC